MAINVMTSPGCKTVIPSLFFIESVFNLFPTGSSTGCDVDGLDGLGSVQAAVGATDLTLQTDVVAEQRLVWLVAIGMRDAVMFEMFLQDIKTKGNL